ncbi:MAG TPA: hypothetical protein VEW46_09005 [Pyrinomonadaceae bacterium]|nr:hypothetical protein [Pyrinomonadaceae bacterium]
MAHRSSVTALLLSLTLLFSLSPQAGAQATSDKPTSQPQPQPAASPAKTAARKTANSVAAKAKIDQQHAMALSLLVSLANDARSFPDQKLRARTLSRIADALWEPDPEQGRALFRRAWDAAVVSDQESLRKMEEERKQQEAKTGSFSIAMPPDLRSEVLRLAAGHDRALGEELLDKLTEAKKQEATEGASPSRVDPFETPAAVRQRLRLARQLLDSDVDRAVQFADPGLTTVTMEGLSFLSFLREKNPGAADPRYARMLAIAESDLQSDANTISLLSSYVFTPHLFVTFLPSGGQQSSQMNARTAPPDVAPELRTAFFRTAAQVLLRPSPNKDQDRSSSGMQGKYLVIRRLMPLFEKHAPREIVEQLRAEVTSLSQGMNNADLRENEDESIQRGIAPERNAEDVDKSLLDRIERAKTSLERDGLYLQLANRAAAKGDMQARDYTEKIEDIEMRKQARSYIDMSLALTVIEKKDFEKALILADKGELSPIQKVWLLAQAAKAMPPAEREKAIEVTEQAAAAARRIGGSEADRPRALLAVANAYLATDRARAWEMMLEVVKASNSAEGFTGEDGRLILRLQSTMQIMRISAVADFNLAGIFKALATENASQSVELARSFESEAPRSSALIAVARALLAEKHKLAD